MEAKLSRDELVAILRQYEAEVTFTKVNGEVRTMPCTLRSDIVPPAPVVAEARQSEKVRKQNDDVLSVWCTDKQAWRSFRLDSILEVAF